jgi:hypothetical protein
MSRRSRAKADRTSGQSSVASAKGDGLNLSRGAFTLLSLFPPVLGFRFRPRVGASRSYEDLAGPKKCEKRFSLRSSAFSCSNHFASIRVFRGHRFGTCGHLHLLAPGCTNLRLKKIAGELQLFFDITP